MCIKSGHNVRAIANGSELFVSLFLFFRLIDRACLTTTTHSYDDDDDRWAWREWELTVKCWGNNCREAKENLFKFSCVSSKSSLCLKQHKHAAESTKKELNDKTAKRGRDGEMWINRINFKAIRCNCSVEHHFFFVVVFSVTNSPHNLPAARHSGHLLSLLCHCETSLHAVCCVREEQIRSNRNCSGNVIHSQQRLGHIAPDTFFGWEIFTMQL